VLVDLKRVSERTKAVNAKLVIDASQSAGAYPLDVQAVKPDFLVAVGYKWLMGPYGLSYLYADEKYCAHGKPIEYSWLTKKGSEDFAGLVDYTDEYKTGARRFDAGGFSSFHNIAMAIAGLTQILDWGVENIQETLLILTAAIEEKATALGLTAPKRGNHVGHMIGIDFNAGQAAVLSKKLADEKIIVSFRGASMRVAPHVFNNMDDINRLFHVIEQV
jgi:selenocysteine lyase/cysteine desulfurase